MLVAGIKVEGDFLGPSEQLIKREGWKEIEKKLRWTNISDVYFPLFKSISQEEDWGHIGYHGADQDYRIYQDVIRFTIEEVLGIPIRGDFHFLRIPGDRDLFLDNIQEFFDYWGFHVNNNTEIRRKQLLSVNYGIYSNYKVIGSSSVLIFANGKTYPVDFENFLAPFYVEMGISSKEIKTLFKLARGYLNRNEGILLTFSENSHLFDPDNEAYNYADTQFYPCKGRGVRYEKRLLSDEYEYIMSDGYVNKKTNIAPQLRMLLNNKCTLNPYSNLCIKRWDLYPPSTIDAYEKKMRDYIKNLDYDPTKAETYRQKLLQLWRLPNE